jgi:hypothetical protein
MKKNIILLFLCIPLFCIAQGLPREYEYDAAGNRTSRKVLNIDLAPPALQDSLLVTRDGVTRDELRVTSYELQELQTELSYIENIAQVEIKVFPNPATEKVTLEIAGWETLQTVVFKLFTLTGQLLQEHPVHSVSTEVSLAGLASGAYILKVQINDRVEDWKIIKQ